MEIKKLLACAAIALGCGSVWAQTDVTSTYLKNAGFDTESDWVSGNINLNPATLNDVSEWTKDGSNSWAGSGAFGYGTDATINNKALPSANSDGEVTGGGLAMAGSWDDGSGFIQYTQAVTLPAGTYKIVYKIYNAHENNNFRANLFGFKTASTTYYGKTTSFPKGAWTEESVSFELTESTEGDITVGFGWKSATSNATPHLVVDYVQILAVTALDKAKDEAKAALPAPTSEFFGLTESQIEDYKSKIDAATSEAEVEAIMEEVNGYNAPAFSGSWNIKNVSAGIYMGNAVLTSTPIATTFEKAANGVYIKVGENYINMAGNNTWSMSASAEAKTAWTFTLTDGKYTIAGPNGLIGSDATADGSALYGNKGTNNNGYWTIDEAISEDEIALAAAKNNLRNAIDNKPTPTANIYGQSDNFVTWNPSIVEAIIECKQEAENAIANSTDIDYINNLAGYLTYGIPYMQFAPELGTPVNIIMAKEGLGWTGNAVTFTYSEGNQNNYAMAYSEVAGESNFNQTVYLSVPDENADIHMYIIDAEGKKWYVTDGTHVGSTVSWAGSQLRMTDVAEDAMPIVIMPSFDKEGVCELINYWTDEHIGSTNNNGFYCSNDNYELAIKPAAQKEIEIKVAEYGTVILPADVDNDFISAKFYSVNSLDGNEVVLTEEGDVLKANTPYIVENQNGFGDASITLGCYANAFKTSYTNGLLTGVYTETLAPVDSYVLQTQNGNQAFYKVAEGKQPKLAPNKAYLTAPAATEAKLNIANATAIKAIDALVNGSAKIYDINGRQINKLQKGVNIVNGVKVMVK